MEYTEIEDYGYKEMNINKQTISRLLIGGVDESDPHLYMRVLFANSLLYVVGLVLFSFVIFHFLISKQYMLGMYDLGALILVLLVYLHLRIKKSIYLTGHLSALGMMLFYITFIPGTQNENLSFVWVFIAPFLFILLNGWKVGSLYLLTLFAVVFPMAYLNIGVWENGAWNSVNVYRFIIGLMLATLIAILVDVTQEIANKREQSIKGREQKYLNELKRLSITDPLTGLYNRRHFNDVFTEKVRALQGSEHFLVFFILDIDHFKAYNDSFGHQAGDEVIQKIAHKIKEFIHRENDLVFRLGGEEFGGLIETRNLEGTKAWLEQLTDAIRELHIPHSKDATLPCVTISGGISAMNVTSNEDMSILYKMADTALYQAKNAGRDRFVSEFY